MVEFRASYVGLIGYTPVIKHSNGRSPFSIGNIYIFISGPFPIAMLDYRSVITLNCSYQKVEQQKFMKNQGRE